MERCTTRQHEMVYLGKQPPKDCNRAMFCNAGKNCSHTKDRSCGVLKAADKLAAYEDTGLEPEEITALAEYYAKLKAGEYILKDDHLRELMQAEKDGRLKIVNIPPSGKCCGCCANFLRETGTAHGHCKTEYRKRLRRGKKELRTVAQSTKACPRFCEEAEAALAENEGKNE